MPKVQSTTYISLDKFLNIAKECEVEVEEQSGYFKLHGPTGSRIYVSKSKSVGRVDFCGFEVDIEEFGVINLGGESIGRVKQKLNLSLSEEAILNNFKKLIEHMKTLPPAEKEKKTSVKIGRRKVTNDESVAEQNEKRSVEDKVAKMALIRKVAEEMGVAVSSKTSTELQNSNAVPATQEEMNLIDSL